tara:strand:+ start:176 stop:1048 length:873 start_codon:yes stop_codon:yes gene_type:complete
MFNSLRTKVIVACLVGGFFTVLVLGQIGPYLQMPAGSETSPGLAFFRDNIMGFYRDGDGDMGFGFEKMSFEGATADASEATIEIEEPTADTTFLFNTDSADTYDILMVPDGEAALSVLVNPLYAATADAFTPVDATIGDLEMYVQRFYLPSPITVGAVYGISEQGAQTASTNGDLGAAIYEDADAGAQLFICAVADQGGTAAVDCDGTDVTLQTGWYRLGMCGEDVSDEMWGGALPTETDIQVVLNQLPLASITVGESANDCTSTGIPPSTTGALEDSTTEYAFWALGPD